MTSNLNKNNHFLFTIMFLLMLFSISSAEPLLGKEVIKIGVAAALKAPYGEGSLHGAMMAADEINAKGGILGSRIEVVSADTAGTAPQATVAIEKLYYGDKVQAIVGAYTSEEATSFQTESAKLKIPILFHGTTYILDKNYNSDPEKYKYYWNYVPSEIDWGESVTKVQLPLIVDTLKKMLGLEKINIAVITDVALWCELFHTMCVDAVNARPDTKLVYTGKVARDSIDFTAELSAVRDKNVQYIVAGLGYPAGYTLIRQLYGLDLPAFVSGQLGIAWNPDTFIKAVGVEAAAYVISDCATTPIPITPNTGKLIGKYVARYKRKPIFGVGTTYNGVKAYAKAVEMAGSVEPDKVVDKLKMVNLPESESWGCGKFVFKENHRVLVSPEGLIIFHYQLTPKGEPVIVAPEKWKPHGVLVPPKMIEVWKKK